MKGRSPRRGSILIARDRFILHEYGPQGPWSHESGRAVIERGDGALIIEEDIELRMWIIMHKEKTLMYETPYVWDEDWNLLV